MDKPRLFIDLDDVIVDLWGFIVQYHNMPHDTDPIEQHWLTVKHVPNLFLKLNPVPNAAKFVNHIDRQYSKLYDIAFLTSIPKPLGSMITAAQDKRSWVNIHISDSIPVHTIIGGINKHQYVNQVGDILIDDLQRNIDAWNRAGGIGIVHTSFENTLEILQKVVDSH